MEPTPHRRLALVNAVLWGAIALIAAVWVLALLAVVVLMIPAIMSGPTDAGSRLPVLQFLIPLAVLWLASAICDLVMLPALIRRAARPGRLAAVLLLVAIGTGTVLPLLTLPLALLGPLVQGVLVAVWLVGLIFPVTARFGAVWEMRRPVR